MMSQRFYRTAAQLLWVVSLVFLLVPPGLSEAAISTFNFEGVVTELDVNAGLFGPVGLVTVGDPFTGHFSYETGPGNPDQAPGDSEVGIYNALEFVVDGSPLIFQNPGISVLHLFVPALFPLEPISIDRFRVVAATPGAPHFSANLTLTGSFGAAFTDDSLPTTLNLSVFDTATVAGIVAFGLFPEPTIDDHGTVESLILIPEPGPPFGPPFGGPPFGGPPFGPPLGDPPFGPPFGNPPFGGPPSGDPPFGPPSGDPPFGPPLGNPRFGGPPFGDPPFGPPFGDPPFGPPFAPRGDGNLNGEVEAGDYAIWANGFGGVSPRFTDGDYNGDGSVDAADYTTWANNFDQTVVAPAGAAQAPAAAGATQSAAVPEPSTLVLSGLGLIGLLAYRWRRRRRA